ncbi:hypothetical protein C0033_11945 [Clostridium sp. chh4-2]|uniref:sensor histidine kinase n=1 Tax=Clostridium sp. chh4-2 TaxID=2067550 RepID=UPI000CCEE5DA|nr:sensor histidine kinase [Clostridium sp. chh4-2]PNV61948.1 hypothetical protein C0033_11945 [Clostridium sp. chh4-2]
MKKFSVLRTVSIKTRLRCLYFVITVLLAIWCSYMMFNYVKDSQDQAVSLNSRIMNEYAEDINSAFTALDSVTKFPVLRSPEPTYLYKYLSSEEHSDAEILAYYADTESNFTKMLMLYPNLDVIAVYDRNGAGLKRSQSVSATTVVQGDMNLPWVRDTLEQMGSVTMRPAANLRDMGLEPPDNGLCAARAIMRVEHRAPVGLVIASISLESSRQYFESNRSYQEQTMGLFSPDGDLIQGNVDESVYSAVNSKLELSGSRDIIDRNHITVKRHGQRYIYNYARFPNGYLAVLETPYGPIIRAALLYQALPLLVLLVFFLGIMLLMNRMILSITEPLSRMEKACQTIQSGDFSCIVEDNSRDELGDFTHSFNTMAKEIDCLIHEVYEKQTIQAQTELQMLRAQINPHFVYNTLETIRASAKRHEEEDLSQMAYLLAKILRYGVTSGSDYVTVEQEMNHLNDYTSLQKLHYRNRVSFHVYIEPKLYSCRMIRLVLQPIVENALYHGIQSIEGEGIIEVIGSRSGDNIVFRITDNGKGIEPETLERLNDYLYGKNEDFKSIGIKNVNRRIGLSYGDGYGIKIQSVPGNGTMVTVVIPLIPESGGK